MEINSILFVGGYPNKVNRYNRVFYQNLIFAMADKGIECTVIAPISVTHYKKKAFMIPREYVQTTPKGSKIHIYHPRYVSLSAKRIAGFSTNRIGVYLATECILKEAKRISKKFDCVYGHFFISAGLAAVKIGNRFKIPSFIAYGESSYETQIRRLFRDLSKKDIDGLSGVISVSGKNSKELEETGLFTDIPTKMIPNAIDLTVFKKKNKSECRKKFGLPDDKFIVGFVGSFTERKGPMRVLEACRRIEDVYTVFAGTGLNKPEGDNVLFADSLPHEEICDFLNAMDIFVLPTLNEGCCNAVLEAMASGTPVVSSNLPFNWDVLDKDNSIMVDPLNIDEIEKAVRDLKENIEKRNQLSESALNTTKELSITARADKIYNFMKECIDNAKSDI